MVCRQRKQKTHAVPDQVQIQEEEFWFPVEIQVTVQIWNKRFAVKRD